ncbi:hypothetical protein NUW54_g3564 [Trametes sanguinea]|uniref:Uncharacterized protein n=1 Tax=Trametes sanguinea TaxID=158606 RepID=A0ACC1Q2A1_9APHY|nr:hypothetical protein NUW54_g3564 [Trametes sanguinea]
MSSRPPTEELACSRPNVVPTVDCTPPPAMDPARIRPPWDVYASQLQPRGLGFPLWSPECTREGWDIHRFDVGWIREGCFHHLLRTANGANEPQPCDVVPEGHQPFNIDSRLVRAPYKHWYSNTPVVCSQSMMDGAIQSSQSSGSRQWVMKFNPLEEEGAFLAHRDLWHFRYYPSKTAPRYMRENASKWLRMANETLGIGLELHDLVFVYGYVKTSHWAVGAYSGAEPGSEGSLTVTDHPSLGTSIVDLRFADKILAKSWWNSGPSARPTRRGTQDSITPVAADRASSTRDTTAPEAGQGSSDNRVSNQDPTDQDAIPNDATQCVFMNYYKISRKNLFTYTIKAAAGYHNLPRSDGDDRAARGAVPSEGSRNVASSQSDSEDWIDPLRYLLDYILNNSDAEYAVACDLELYALFKVNKVANEHCRDTHGVAQGRAFPRNVLQALSEMRPPIHVDSDGTGTHEPVAHFDHGSPMGDITTSNPASRFPPFTLTGVPFATDMVGDSRTGQTPRLPKLEHGSYAREKPWSVPPVVLPVQ